MNNYIEPKYIENYKNYNYNYNYINRIRTEQDEKKDQRIFEFLCSVSLPDAIDEIKEFIQQGRVLYINQGLYAACKVGNLKIVKFLFEAGASDYNGCLQFACLYNHLDIVKYTINKATFGIKQSFMYICEQGYNLEIAKLLIARTDTIPKFVLFLAFSEGNMDLVHLLVKHGKDLSEKQQKIYINYMLKSVVKRTVEKQNVHLLRLNEDLTTTIGSYL